jgi:hypothetical protein
MTDSTTEAQMHGEIQSIPGPCLSASLVRGWCLKLL